MHPTPSCIEITPRFFNKVSSLKFVLGELIFLSLWLIFAGRFTFRLLVGMKKLQ